MQSKSPAKAKTSLINWSVGGLYIQRSKTECFRNQDRRGLMTENERAVTFRSDS
jgi:hypothetical protein